MSEIKLPFGQMASGRMVAIDEVVRGLDCECFCPACKTALVAVKGEIYQHHFRHYSTACEHAAETALHLFAKQCICDEPELLALPIALGKVTAAKPDGYRLPSGIIPDVHIIYDTGESLAVEVWVAHQVPIGKVETYNEQQQTAIEIDLRRYHHSAKNDVQWREVVLSRAPRFWLCPPKAERDKIAARNARLLAIEQARLDAARKLDLARQAERIEAQRAYDKLLAEKAELTAQQAEQDRLASARQAAIWQAQEVERQAQRVDAARLLAEHRHAQEVAEQRLMAEMEPPSLQHMVEDHAGYHRITPEAWAAYDQAMFDWLSRHNSGEFWRPPYLELQKRKERAYWREHEANIRD